MKPEEISELALTMPEAFEDEPFGPGVVVYKVVNKIFVVLRTGGVATAKVTLKCEPSLALHLRAQYEAVSEGYHVNKKHWNTVLLDGSVPDEELHDMVTHSYQQVVAGLTKAQRERLGA